MPLLPSPAVVRAGELLSIMGASPSQARSASELARLAGVPRATCASLLLGLTESGLVMRDEDLRYRLGPTCITLGDAARTANPVFRAAARHAEAVARDLSLVAAVSIRDADTTRVVQVFDFGPSFGMRPRIGDTIALVPPFGAVFVAWDDEPRIDAWLDRTEPALTRNERKQYRTALDTVRARGFGVSVASDRQAELAAALERLAREPGVPEAVRARDTAMREIAHGAYLASELNPERPERLVHVSAPVFDSTGRVDATIILLGPGHELSAAEISALGSKVAAAAVAATIEVGGSPGVHR